jgi:hypothetical protein
MGKTRNQHTPEERLEYWKKRMVERLRTVFGRYEKDIQEIIKYKRHVNLKNNKIQKILEKIVANFNELEKEILKTELDKSVMDFLKKEKAKVDKAAKVAVK